MLKLFRRSPDRGGKKPSLDSVHFDTLGFADRGETAPGQVHVWHTPEGDGVGLHFLSLPPDLPAHARSVDEFAASYRQLLRGPGDNLLEIAIVVADGCSALRTLVSVPQEPSGRTYLGSLTLPFRDFSFVLKCQCEEHAPTGLKESLLLERRLAAGESVRVERDQLHIADWNPDDPRYDAQFPDHPVARARRILDHLTASLIVADEIRSLPRFDLPSNRS